MEPDVWKWGVHDKTDLPDAFHKCHMCEFGGLSASPPFPRKKIEFGEVISCCIEGLTCTLQSFLSRFSITFSIPSTHPHYFYANLDKLQDPYFQKVGYIPPGPLGSTSEGKGHMKMLCMWAARSLNRTLVTDGIEAVSVSDWVSDYRPQFLYLYCETWTKKQYNII